MLIKKIDNIRMMQHKIQITFVITFILSVTICESSEKKSVPPGMDPDLFPPPNFDKNAPFCQSAREPCGFYSFSLGGNYFKWIKSWCRCLPRFSCVYDRTDMKMRVYRHTCVLDEENIEESIKSVTKQKINMENNISEINNNIPTFYETNERRRHHLQIVKTTTT